MLDIAKFTLFIQVADVGSLSRVAALNGTSPSAISRQLGQFEGQCGGQLFHRTGRGVVLSKLGELVLPRARRLVEEAHQLDVDIRSALASPQGEVRFGMLAAAADPLLAILVRRLAADYPDIHLHVVEGSSGQMEQWVAMGTVDVAFMVREKREVASTEIALTTNPLHLVMASDDPLAQEPSIPFKNLAVLPLILPGQPNGLRTSLALAAKMAEIELNVVLEVDSLSMQQMLVADGFGYAIGSRGFVTERHEHRLSSVELVDPTIERTVVLAATTQRPLSLAARLTLDLAREIAVSLAGQTIWQKNLGGAR